jgi:hypothetical protein
MSENEDKPAGKSVKDRAKEIGRDGAYLEVDADKMFDAARSGELAKAQMLVITSMRVDVSDPVIVEKLKTIVVKDGIAPQEMDSQQASQFIFRMIFEKGIDKISGE